MVPAFTIKPGSQTGTTSDRPTDVSRFLEIAYRNPSTSGWLTTDVSFQFWKVTTDVATPHAVQDTLPLRTGF